MEVVMAKPEIRIVKHDRSTGFDLYCGKKLLLVSDEESLDSWDLKNLLTNLGYKVHVRRRTRGDYEKEKTD